MSQSIAAAGAAAFWLLASAATASAQTATITGAVSNAATSQAVAGVTVSFCSGASSAPVCVSGLTNAQGMYAIVLPVGTHYGYTANAPQLINLIYEGLACPENLCSPQGAVLYGTPTTVAAGQVLVRDFRLPPAARVRGNVRDAATAAPLMSVDVLLLGFFQGQFTRYGQATTDASGAYAIGDLPAGTYYAMTSQSAGYVNEFFGDVWCPGQCSFIDATSGAPIVVASGSDVAGRDFALRRGGSISGTITGVLAPGNATPVAGATIFAFALLGDALAGSGGTTTDATGHYSIAGLPDGLYYVLVRAPLANGLLGQLYGGAPCGEACSLGLPNGGSPIVVAGGRPTTGRDVQLIRGGSIAGTVVASATLLPVPTVVTASALVNGFMRSFGSAQTDASGGYTIPALPPGNYSLSTYSYSSVVNEVYPNVPCPSRCEPLVAANQTVPVAQYATTSGRDFALDPAGIITGVVTDGRTGTPLSPAFVNLYTRVGGAVVLLNQARSDASGIHEFTNLPSGTFWAAAFVAGQRLRSQIFEGIDCAAPDCGGPAVIATGTPIVVDPPAPYTGVNFNLTPGQQPPLAPLDLSSTTSGFRVRLTWRPNPNGAAPTGYVVEAGFSQGTTAVTLPTPDPLLDVSGVPPGRYFVRVRARNAFGTGPASSDFVLVVNGDGLGSPGMVPLVTAWMSGRRLNMLWSDPSLGERPTSYVVEVGTAAGLSNLASLPVTMRSFSYDPVPDGFYFVRVRARVGANPGPASRELMLKVGSGPSPPSAPLGWTYRLSGNAVTFSWSAPLDGSPTSYLVEAGSMIGLSNLAVFSTGSAATTLTVPNVPSGIYYVRLRAVNTMGAGPPSYDTLIVVP